MNKSFGSLNLVVIILIIIFIAFPLGYIVGNAQSSSQTNSNTILEENDEHMAESHTHKLYEVSQESAPQISNLAVTPDAKSGWNISFDTANFVFSPENVSSAHVDGQGHAHLYIDGEKITRLYSANYYLADIGDVGEHNVVVVLNTNDHRDYAVDGASVSALSTVSVSEDDSHSHKEDNHEERTPF